MRWVWVAYGGFGGRVGLAWVAASCGSVQSGFRVEMVG